VSKFDLNEVQRYFDDKTGEPLQLCFDEHEVEVDAIEVFLRGIPLLKNPRTGEYFYPDKTKRTVLHFADEAKSRNETVVELSPAPHGRACYPYAERLDFLYSHIDYEFIPGLYRPCGNGSLTPVFFNIAVLNKYAQDPRYDLDLFSETYGTIWHGTTWSIQFGINSSKKVVMWLKDIATLPDSQLHYLRSENIESDHDIHSEFYNAQIEVRPSPPCRETKLFSLRHELNEATKSRFGFGLYVLEGEVSSVIEKLGRPVFWDDEHVAPVMESLNRIFVESINISSIKADLKAVAAGHSLKSLRSLKSLKIWLETRLGLEDAPDLMCPFYVLYDYRVLTCHLQSAESAAELRGAINLRLDRPRDCTDHESIYSALLDQMVYSMERILSACVS